MPNNTISTLAALICFLAFVTLALIVANNLSLLKKKANQRLASSHLYWDSFRLYQLPEGEHERREFLLKRGQQEGFERGAMTPDMLTASLIGLALLLRWFFYPPAKRRALKELASDRALSADELKDLIAQLA